MEKAALVDREYRHILDYGDRWQLVFDAVGLDPVPEPAEPAPGGGPARGWGAGESPEHMALKAFVLANPELFGAGRDWAGVDEHEMPSGDRIDVHFTKGSSWTGVEVKSLLSDDRVLQRGVYQIVKYPGPSSMPWPRPMASTPR